MKSSTIFHKHKLSEVDKRYLAFNPLDKYITQCPDCNNYIKAIRYNENLYIIVDLGRKIEK